MTRLISNKLEALLYLLSMRGNNAFEYFFRSEASPYHLCVYAEELAPVVKELYLTIHQPIRSGYRQGADKFSLRLWIEKPEKSHSGHPDWCPRTAVFEVWRSKSEIVSEIEKRWPNAEKELLMSPGNQFCEEMVIYTIKSPK